MIGLFLYRAPGVHRGFARQRRASGPSRCLSCTRASRELAGKAGVCAGCPTPKLADGRGAQRRPPGNERFPRSQFIALTPTCPDATGHTEARDPNHRHELDI